MLLCCTFSPWLRRCLLLNLWTWNLPRQLKFMMVWFAALNLTYCFFCKIHILLPSLTMLYTEKSSPFAMLYAIKMFNVPMHWQISFPYVCVCSSCYTVYIVRALSVLEFAVLYPCSSAVREPCLFLIWESSPFALAAPRVLECCGLCVVVYKVPDTVGCIPHLPPLRQGVLLDNSVGTRSLHQ